MGLRVNTNLAALTAQRNLSAVSSRLEGNFSRLSSGLRIATAADDAAGLGISERMRSNIRALAVASRNAHDGLSVTQTADGAIQEVSNNIARLRELAVQASNGTLSTADRSTLDAEFQTLISEIDRVASQTSFNGLNLLDGSLPTMDIQVGANAGETITVNMADVTTATLGLTGLDLTSAANAGTAITAIVSATDTVASARGTLGAAQNRMSSAIASIANARENLSAAESRIRDVDVAYETSDLARNSILQQAAVSVLAQANAQPQLALQLLQ
jgi:flagellin